MTKNARVELSYADMPHRYIRGPLEKGKAGVEVKMFEPRDASAIKSSAGDLRLFETNFRVPQVARLPVTCDNFLRVIEFRGRQPRFCMVIPVYRIFRNALLWVSSTLPNHSGDSFCIGFYPARVLLS